MKRFAAILLMLIGLPALAQTTTTYVGTIKDLTGATVTSGRVTWTLSASGATISGTGAFVATAVSCTINSSGTPVSSSNNSNPCVITNNTALTPSGTSYTLCIQPQFASPGSCMITYAYGGTVDISTLVPTSATQPYYGVAALYQANTWTQPQTFSQTINGTTNGNLPLSGGTLTGDLTLPDSITSITPVYDIRAYGAVSGATSVTTNIQNAINAAFNAGGGVVYLPPGIWNVNGAIQASCDAVICIPPAAETGPSVTIKIVGSAKQRQDSDWTSGIAATTGTILISNATGTDTNSAIIGATISNGGAAGLSNGDVYISDIDFRTYTNPTIGCVNLQKQAGADIRYVRCEVGQGYNGTTKVEPSNIVYGITMPGVDNDTLSILKYSEISGYNTGIRCSEHCDVENVTAAYCIDGAEMDAGFHPATLIHFVSQESGTPIYFPGVGQGPLPVNIIGLDLEIDSSFVVCTSGNPWCYSGNDVYDPSNNAYGDISFVKVVAGVGATSSPLSVVGGNNLTVDDMRNQSIGSTGKLTFTNTNLPSSPFGIETVSVPTCSTTTTQFSNCSVATVTWPVSFGSASYNVVCNLNGANTTSAVTGPFNITGPTFSVGVINLTSGTALTSGNIVCIGKVNN